MPMKDRFSAQAEQYRRFRPTYPAALYDHILPLVQGRERAWDAGTGNGQVAVVLGDYFQEVIATDISKRQMQSARPHPRVRYRLARAEAAPLPDHSVDLITVAQALHWFAFPAFFREVRRVVRPGGVLATWGYGLLRLEAAPAQALIEHFYSDTVGPYWDPERRHIDTAYQSIPFPDWQEITTEEVFYLETHFTLDHLLGYLGTWSSVQHFLASNQADPLAVLRRALLPHWPAAAERTVVFPLFLRMFRLPA